MGPEKIYISTNSQDGTYYISNQYKRLIEYVHTDAFIKKACEWLKEQDEMVGVSFQEDFLERFQNYMKG